jgi:hypothetical protein
LTSAAAATAARPLLLGAASPTSSWKLDHTTPATSSTPSMARSRNKGEIFFFGFSYAEVMETS